MTNFSVKEVPSVQGEALEVTALVDLFNEKDPRAKLGKALIETGVLDQVGYMGRNVGFKVFGDRVHTVFRIRDSSDQRRIDEQIGLARKAYLSAIEEATRLKKMLEALKLAG